MPKSWIALVFPNGGKGAYGQFDRSKYMICLSQQLYKSLKSGEVFSPKAIKYNDPRAKMLESEVWNSIKHEVMTSLQLPKIAKIYVEQQSQRLHLRLVSLAKTIGSNPDVTLKLSNEHINVSVTPLEAIPLQATQLELNNAITERLPEIGLPELMLELNARTGFIDALLEPEHARQESTEQNHQKADNEFVSVPAKRRYATDLETSIAAILLAEGCNIGLKSVSQEFNPSLRLDRLERVKAQYFTADSIRHANQCLVAYHSQQALTQQWGGGEVASADGIRFIVPAKNLAAQANSKYFGSKRGITFYTLVSDQFTQINGTVIPGTMRDSLYLLASLLEQDTKLEPKEIMTDTAGYSDVIFGLFHLLGFCFSPRLKDIGKARFWRIDRKADYGQIDKLVRHPINTGLITEQWDEVMRLVGSLKLGKLKATDVTRVVARNGTLSGLGRAIEEIGRISKTMYLCEYLEDETYRRRIHTQLNHGELRNDTARTIFHGRKGKIYKHYQKGLEEQLGALALVVNAVVVWNTDYMSRIIGLLYEMGLEVLDEDIARVTPLKTRHIRVLGEFNFNLHPDVIDGDLRPLRDPNAFIGLEDLDAGIPFNNELLEIE